MGIHLRVHQACNPGLVFGLKPRTDCRSSMVWCGMVWYGVGIVYGMLQLQSMVFYGMVIENEEAVWSEIYANMYKGTH